LRCFTTAQSSNAEGIGCTGQGVFAHAFEMNRSVGFWPMKQPLSFTKGLKKKRLIKRALNDLAVNRLGLRQGGIIGIPFCLSTAQGKNFSACQ
jgi:hypothetical protein